MSVLLLILGLATLILGGEFLVRGSVHIAHKLNLSSLVIGMTVVSFGTSAPELIVSLKAALSGNSDIALGNVVGSNIANIALVLGLTVLIFPMVVDRNTKTIDWPMMMFSSVLFYLFASDGVIKMWEGLILFLLLVGFTYFIINKSVKDTKSVKDSVKPNSHFGISILYLIGGLIGLYFGAEWLLDGAVTIAKDLGMEERIIGVTIVAFGTSVPELVTSCVAAFKKESGISIGNLIGSNIFNILSVIGISAFITPMSVSKGILSYDMIWMLAISLALLPMILFGAKLGRTKGFMLFSLYLVYIFTLLV